jgi:outer membrane protein assembly factor BamB
MIRCEQLRAARRVLKKCRAVCLRGFFHTNMNAPSRHFILLLALSMPSLAANWPAWRGPDGTGISAEKELPLKWSATENVRWHVDLPEPGNSSPIVWGDRVFVTQAVSGESRRTLMCLNRADGKILWQSGVAYAEREQTQRSNPYCSATPVTDGERVIVSFGSAGLYCYDFAGKEMWHRDFGRMSHMFGNASSPMLAGELCIFPFGPDEKARLIAVNKRTGETAWEATPPKADPSEQQPMRGGPGGPPGAGPGGPPDGGPGGPGGPGGDRRRFGGGRSGGPGGASWSTPVLIKAGDREELVMSFPNRLVAYDPKTGKELWVSKGIGGTIYTSPVWGEGTVFATTSGPAGGGAIAVKPGGAGDVTESHRVWQIERAKSAIGSGVIHEGHLYTISQDGIAGCVDLKTGSSVWEERLAGSGGRGSSWSSILLADGKLYVPNQSGDVFVLRAAPKFELLSKNSVSESTNASMAASDGQLFLRTDRGLWCFAAAK